MCPPTPVGLECLLPSAWVHYLQIQTGMPAVKGDSLLPMVEPWGWKSFEKSLVLSGSWWWGSHLQPPSLGSPHLRMGACAPGRCCRNWGTPSEAEARE